MHKRTSIFQDLLSYPPKERALQRHLQQVRQLGDCTFYIRKYQHKHNICFLTGTQKRYLLHIARPEQKNVIFLTVKKILDEVMSRSFAVHLGASATRDKHSNVGAILGSVFFLYQQTSVHFFRRTAPLSPPVGPSSGSWRGGAARGRWGRRSWQRSSACTSYSGSVWVVGFI